MLGPQGPVDLGFRRHRILWVSVSEGPHFWGLTLLRAQRLMGLRYPKT